MNELSVLVEDGLDFPWLGRYEAYLLQAVATLGIRHYQIAVTLCRDARIRELNRLYRAKDEPTDVLSFVADPEPGLEETGGCFGDLLISMDTLRVNSAYFQVSEDEELKRISLHGLLHLMGWDHQTNDRAEPMLQYQEELLEQFKERLF